MKNSSVVKRIILHTILLVVAVGMIFPFLWMVGLSLSEQGSSSLTQILSHSFSLVNYVDAFSSGPFTRYLINSVFVSTVVAVGNAFTCMLVGYAFSRREFIGKRLLFFSVLAVLTIPPHVVMIPLYRLMVRFDWINTYWALIIPWLVTPFGVFMMKQYIDGLPRELEDAARIDGAGEWKILFRIVMPLARPMLVVLMIYEFLASWNSFLFPFLFTNEEAMRTLPVGLAFYQGKQSIDWGHLMAGASISALPIIFLFILFQKQIIAGLTAGALKE